MARYFSLALAPAAFVFALLSSVHAGSDFAQAVEHFENRRYADAQPLFESVARTEPTHADVAYYLGALALRRGDESEAVKFLESATTLDPKSARALNALGDAYGMTAQKAGLLSKFGWAKKCLAAYERAVSLDPDTVAFRECLLEYYAQAPGFAGGGMDKAYAQAEEIRKRDGLKGGLALCRLYGSDKKWEQAFGIADKLERTHPGNPRVLFQIGRLAALSGKQLERGKTALFRYLETPPAENEPSWATAHLRLGNIHEKSGDPGAARKAYEAALRLDPNLELARDGLSRVGVR